VAGATAGDGLGAGSASEARAGPGADLQPAMVSSRPPARRIPRLIDEPWRRVAIACTVPGVGEAPFAKGTSTPPFAMCPNYPAGLRCGMRGSALVLGDTCLVF